MAYAIEQVVRWSDMALPDLLEELISDGDARKGYFRLAGIVPKKIVHNTLCSMLRIIKV